MYICNNILTIDSDTKHALYPAGHIYMYICTCTYIYTYTYGHTETQDSGTHGTGTELITRLPGAQVLAMSILTREMQTDLCDVFPGLAPAEEPRDDQLASVASR